jgi:hypothetical protein
MTEGTRLGGCVEEGVGEGLEVMEEVAKVVEAGAVDDVDWMVDDAGVWIESVHTRQQVTG